MSIEAAIARLKQFHSDSDAIYTSVEFQKKAAVCVILFKDRDGDLSLVMTVRSSKLRTYPGQAAFPGGRCDALEEDAWSTALRESNEEIGFCPENFKVTKLCMLPCYLSRHFLVVRPCVIYVEPKDEAVGYLGLEQIATKLNAAEVQAVYTVKLHRFLTSHSSIFGEATESNWAGHLWIYMEWAIRRDDPETQWLYTPNIEPNYEVNLLTGLTAHMVVDCARVAYDTKPLGFPFAEEVGYDRAVNDYILKPRSPERL